MNKKELQYIKENYFGEGLDLKFLLEAVGEVMESESILKQRRLLREQVEGTSLTLESIPEISVTELGWTDVKTVGNQEVSGPARNQLLQFTRNIQGSGLEEKVASLAEFYNNPDSINLEGGSPGQRIANALSYLVFYKTLTKVQTSMQRRPDLTLKHSLLCCSKVLKLKRIPAQLQTLQQETTHPLV